MNITFTEEELEAFTDKVRKAAQPMDRKEVLQRVFKIAIRERGELYGRDVEIPKWLREIFDEFGKAMPDKINWKELI